jgi:NAD(P)H-hydrate epimerase
MITVSYNTILVSLAKARALDGEAAAWGLDSFALVEAAGRACAQVFADRIPHAATGEIIALAGNGNNAADALVMLKVLILDAEARAFAEPSRCRVFYTRSAKNRPDGQKTPLSQALLDLEKMGVQAREWDETVAPLLAKAGIIIDGITGTGLESPLRGMALEMAGAVNALRKNRERPFIVSVDLPSGNFDGWQPDMPVMSADATLAIEPQKLCLYTPAARIHAGTISPVGGIFPPALIKKHCDAELMDWEYASTMVPPVPQSAHKYERGLVEIRAGSAGATGAALLASLGAQAAGAGLVRLIVDPSIYPIIAPACSGVMAVPACSGVAGPGNMPGKKRFRPSAVLLGPGWGNADDRRLIFEACLPLEEQGVPLILDADAIPLAKNIAFHGNALITPHAGEFSAFAEIPKEKILADPIPPLRHLASEKNMYILFKSQVLYIAAPDGRIGIVDGMKPVLAAGGSGDVLSGFCASIAARQKAGGCFDGYACACAAASLLVRTAETESVAGRFVDPAELARAAAAIAGEKWLAKGEY